MSNVIYEVSVSIAPHRVDEYDMWLPGHVEEFLELPGFIDAQTFHGEGDDGKPLRSVHYRLTDEQALNGYLEQHAAGMRAQSSDTFGRDVQTQRRILTPTARRNTERCRDCNCVLDGQYCAACGQRHRSRMISVWELLRDVLDDVLSWDSRLWRSLRPLLLAPGKLTVEYLSGRRTSYTPPLRMYLVLSLLFFVLSTLPSLSDMSAETILGLDKDAVETPLDGDDLIIVGDGTSPAADASGDGTELPDDPCQMETFEANVPGVDEELLRAKVRGICIAMQTASGRARLVNEFVEMLPTLFILMLPLIALASRMLYPFKRRYYVEHLLFFTHYQSFVFFMLIGLMGVTALVSRVESVAFTLGPIKIAAGVYAVYYLYRALRRVFQQGRLITLIKMLVITMTYAIGAGVLAGVGLAIAALSLG